MPHALRAPGRPRLIPQGSESLAQRHQSTAGRSHSPSNLSVHSTYHSRTIPEASIWQFDHSLNYSASLELPELSLEFWEASMAWWNMTRHVWISACAVREKPGGFSKGWEFSFCCGASHLGNHHPCQGHPAPSRGLRCQVETRSSPKNHPFSKGHSGRLIQIQAHMLCTCSTWQHFWFVRVIIARGSWWTILTICLAL